MRVMVRIVIGPVARAIAGPSAARDPMARLGSMFGANAALLVHRADARRGA
jgi:hypothetical protein